MRPNLKENQMALSDGIAVSQVVALVLWVAVIGLCFSKKRRALWSPKVVRCVLGMAISGAILTAALLVGLSNVIIGALSVIAMLCCAALLIVMIRSKRGGFV